MAWLGFSQAAKKSAREETFDAMEYVDSKVPLSCQLESIASDRCFFWGGNHSGNFGVLRFVRLCQIVMCENFRPGKGKDQICGVCLACFGGHQDVMPQKVTKDVRLVGRYDIEQRQQRLEGFLESQTQTLQSCLDMWQLS